MSFSSNKLQLKLKPAFRIGGVLFFVFTLLLSCQKVKPAQAESGNNEELKYATGFQLEHRANYSVLNLLNPWGKGELMQRYYLVKNDSVNVPVDGVKLMIPLRSIATSAVTHVEFISQLSELESIIAVCNPELIYNEKLHSRLEAGNTENLGDAFSINVEKTLVLQPGALMMSGYNTTDANAQRIERAGIPVIYNNEWMEESLLARAEWIKFVAAFYDKDALADSLFNEIESNYNSMKLKTTEVKHKPVVMSGSNFRGTWYMPSGKNYMTQLYKDAGAAYYYENDTTSSGSLPLTVEAVLKNFSDAEVWLNCNFSTISELIREDSRHALFRPVTKGEVYNFNKRMLPGGANDFWESSVARPDLLLADVITILHPQLLPGRELFYAEKLKE